MTKPYYSDEHVRLWHGDTLATLAEIPDGSVGCIVTSPPYYGLRSYLPDDHPDKQYEIGTEDSPAEYVERIRKVFAECRRVLAKDGTLWLNLGDSYYSGRGNPGPNADDGKNVARRGWVRPIDRPGMPWGKPKSLLGIPWRSAFALQDDGWILRNAIVWNKPNAMPESVTDRLSTRHETIFLLTKSARYWFDLDPIREDRTYTRPPIETSKYVGTELRGQRHGGNPRSMHTTGEYSTDGRNPGDVWTIPTSPFPEAHFATYPSEIPRRCIAAGAKPGSTILDPFHGSGTTGHAAAQLGHPYIGIDLNADYLDLSLRTRLAQTALIDGGAA